MSGKAIVLETIRGLPEDSTLDEILEALASRRGGEAAEAERPLASLRDGAGARARIDEELIEFIASGPGPRLVAEFRPSEQARQRVADLIAREKSSGLSADETSELDHYLRIEHLMRLAKARARQHLGDE
jgi:hypothetical protein